MISTLRVITAYRKLSDELPEGYVGPGALPAGMSPNVHEAGRLALSFCETALKLPGFNNTPIASRVREFAASLKDEGVKEGGLANMVSATKAAWEVTEGASPVQPKSKWYKDSAGARAFVFVKAFVESFRTITARVRALPPGDSDILWKATQDVDRQYMHKTKKEDDADSKLGPAQRTPDNLELYKRAKAKFDVVKPAPVKDVPVDEEDAKTQTESEKPAEKKEPKKPVEGPFRGKVEPVKEEVKEVSEKLKKTVEQFNTNTKSMPMDDQEKLTKLMEQVLSLMSETGGKSRKIPEVVKKSSVDAVARLLSFVKPYLAEFLPRLRTETRLLPVSEPVWRDPVKFADVLAGLDEGTRLEALKITERLLGQFAALEE